MHNLFPWFCRMSSRLMNVNHRQIIIERVLIPMSSMEIEPPLNEENSLIDSEINHEGQLTTVLPQQRRLGQNLQSMCSPHLSDRILRIIFLLFITFIGCTSFTIALIVSSSFVQFKHQCPLYASFQYQILRTSTSNWTVKISPLTEKFSSQSICDFCTFYNVSTFIYCIMTCFFFILFNSDQRVVTTNDKCLIIPWCPISLILGFVSLINAGILTNGFLKFCTAMISHNHRLQSCTQINDLHFEQYPNVTSFFIYMLIAIIASWIQLILFIGLITVLTIRLGSSFDWNDHPDARIDVVLQSIKQT